MRNPVVSRRYQPAIVAGFAAAALAAGGALHSVNAAPSGLTQLPSTDIYPKGTIHLDIDTQGIATRGNQEITTGLTYGVGPGRDGVFGRTEIGFDYNLIVGKNFNRSSGTGPQNLQGQFGERNLLFNIKTQLYNNDASGTRVVIGAYRLGLKPKDNNQSFIGLVNNGALIAARQDPNRVFLLNGQLITGAQYNQLIQNYLTANPSASLQGFSPTNFRGNLVYLLASKNFKWGRVHAGIAHSFAPKEELRFLVLGSTPTAAPGGVVGLPFSDDRTFFQLAYEKLFLNNKAQFIADYYSGKSYFSRHSASVAYYLNKTSAVQLGIIRSNAGSFSPRNLIYLGYDVNFGGSAEEARDEEKGATAEEKESGGTTETRE